jgi:hypothetical protein
MHESTFIFKSSLAQECVLLASMVLAQSSHTNLQREMIAYSSRSLDPDKKN